MHDAIGLLLNEVQYVLIVNELNVIELDLLLLVYLRKEEEKEKEKEKEEEK